MSATSSQSSQARSAQDAMEALGQIEPVSGPGPASVKNRSFNLVVCGATNINDGFMFRDFVAYTMTMKERGMAADCLTGFPVQQYFVTLKNKHPSIDDIKFGKYEGGAHIYSYSGVDFCHNNHWWTHVDVGRLAGEVHAWISRAIVRAQPGDIVNIFLVGHGRDGDGAVKIGMSWVTPAAFYAHLSAFGTDVAINIVVMSCYSGLFVEALKTSNQTNYYCATAAPPNDQTFSMSRSVSGRFRNSRFTNAFVRSIGFPAPGASRETCTIHDHHTYVRDAVRNVTPNQPLCDPQFYINKDISSMLDELLYLPSSRSNSPTFHTAPSSPRPSSPPRPRQIDWPEIIELVHNSLQNQSTKNNSQIMTLAPSASALVKSEVARCNVDRGYLPDLGVYCELSAEQPDWSAILDNLYWKVFRQAFVWDIYQYLLHANLLDEEFLTVPMNLMHRSMQTHLVTQFLKGLSPLGDLSNESFTGNIPLQSAGWYSDIEWLATVVVRSGAQITQIHDALQSAEVFGDMNESAIVRFKESNPNFQVKQDTRDREGKLAPDGRVPPETNVFGFWLPHGLSSDTEKRGQEIKERLADAQRIIEIYKERMSPEFQIPILTLEYDDGESDDGDHDDTSSA